MKWPRLRTLAALLLAGLATQAQARPVEGNSLGMDLVRIPAGEFLMGSEESPEAPARHVRISRAFWLGRCE